ncbi:hypothetical protein AB0B68_04280 [Micromonospora sp. NPDC049049]|uniref:P-loop ATPase, Sll1717 family n=1 Tax=Micromonospora sp. NPDC049049 TaxID=3155495 RepID=UPI0033D1D01F
MAKAKGIVRRLRGEFSLGGEIAEADGLLNDAFFDSSLYRALRSKDDRRCFVVGRTGSGKSATLLRLKEENPAHVIEINPIDLSLPYITDLGVVQYLSALEVHLDSLYNALWKHVLLIEIVKHRYSINSPDAKQRFLSSVIDKIRGDSKKKAALAYLEEFEGKFWCETDERVRDITHKIEDQFKSEAAAKFGVKPADVNFSTGDVSISSREERVELAQRFQRVVNETQLPKLNTMMQVLNDEILDSPQNFTYIVIDDLDKNWASDRVKNDLIRNLFQVVFDLKRVQNLKVIVALRTNIFEALDFSTSGGQGEKFRALTMRVRWTPGEIESLLDERARVAGTLHNLPDINSVRDILPGSNNTARVKPLAHILRRTLMRPRDAIAYVNECLSLAEGKERLTWEVLNRAEVRYSRGRLLALRDEWEPTYPGIEKMLHCFNEAPGTLSPEMLTKYLDDSAFLMADVSFTGIKWLTELTSPLWNSGDSDEWAELYQPLVKLLYDIGFLGTFIANQKEAVFSQDDPDIADAIENLRRATGFMIHPAFWAALSVSNAAERRGRRSITSPRRG